MTPHQKRSTLFAILDCLQNFLGDSLPDGWKEELIGKHLEHAERNIEETTIIPLPLAKEAWLTIWQQGGGLKTITWAPHAAEKKSRERTAVDELTRCLAAILHLGPMNVQVRFKKPHEWHRMKGRPVPENGIKV